MQKILKSPLQTKSDFPITYFTLIVIVVSNLLP